MCLEFDMLFNMCPDMGSDMCVHMCVEMCAGIHTLKYTPDLAECAGVLPPHATYHVAGVQILFGACRWPIPRATTDPNISSENIFMRHVARHSQIGMLRDICLKNLALG